MKKQRIVIKKNPNSPDNKVRADVDKLIEKYLGIMNTKVIREAFNDWLHQQEDYRHVSINEAEEMLCAGSSAPIEVDGRDLYEAFKAGISFAMTTR